MGTKAKIKITDNMQLREEVDVLYTGMDQISASKWAICIAKNILVKVGVDYKEIDELVEGFKINEQWQINQATTHDVRKAGFKIHKIARENESDVKKAALRAAGHAVSSGHMKEHAMVAADYAIKAIGLLSNNNSEAITLERTWQLNEIKKL